MGSKTVNNSVQHHERRLKRTGEYRLGHQDATLVEWSERINAILISRSRCLSLISSLSCDGWTHLLTLWRHNGVISEIELCGR